MNCRAAIFALALLLPAGGVATAASGHGDAPMQDDAQTRSPQVDDPAGSGPNQALSELPSGVTLDQTPDASAAVAQGPDTARTLDSLFARLAKAKDADSAAVVARQIETRWLNSGSPTVDLLMRRATLALAANDLPLARDLADAIVRLKPSYAEGWSMRATIEYQMDDYGPALADLRRTLALEPRHWQAMAGLGMILVDLDRKKAALEAFDAALAIHPYLEEALKGRDELATAVEGQEL